MARSPPQATSAIIHTTIIITSLRCLNLTHKRSEFYSSVSEHIFGLFTLSLTHTHLNFNSQLERHITVNEQRKYLAKIFSLICCAFKLFISANLNSFSEYLYHPLFGCSCAGAFVCKCSMLLIYSIIRTALQWRLCLV